MRDILTELSYLDLCPWISDSILGMNSLCPAGHNPCDCEINHIKIFVKLQESRKDSIFNKYEGIIIFPMDNLIKTFTKLNFIFYSKSDGSMDGYYCFHMN